MSGAPSLKNYEIKQKLGSGSYGIIYKATNRITKQTVVLKQISLSRMSEKARKNAANEAHIMGKLKHPFIVCYYESFVEDNNLNIIMQFCDSGDLCYYLKLQNKKFMKQDKIWKFFIQITMGLEHIHKNKILHRDIKTLNIFLNKNESVKIGDLGVAKMLNANDFAHTMVGTPFYLSPELCEEKPYNQKSDIWALGCLLYQLCTFRHPFQAANQASLILKIIRGKYEPIPEFYSKQLREMIGACLQRDYKRRPTANMILSKPSVKKMMEDFELNKVVQQFYRKPILNSAPILKTEQKIIENKPPVSKLQNKPPIQKPKKCLDEGQPVVKQPVRPLQQQKKQVIKQKKFEPAHQQNNIINKRRQSQPALKVSDHKDDKPKILFGSQNKADFISALQMKVKEPSPQQKRQIQIEKRQFVKKNPISFQIPWKGQEKQKSVTQQKESQDKIVVHNKHVLVSQPAPPIQYKNNQVVQKVKMQKKIQPKVYQILKSNQKPMGIIKSGGFSQIQPRPETGQERKKAESNDQRSQKKIQQHKMSSQKNNFKIQQKQKQIVGSMKNMRKSSEQRPSYILKKPQQQKIQPSPTPIMHLPPKIKKQISPSYIPVHPVPSGENNRRPPKHLPHQKSSTSASRLTEVTKQEQDMVANLPDVIKKESGDSDSDSSPKNRGKQNNMDKSKTSTGSKIKFKQIDDDKVLKMYQQMLKSSRQSKNNSMINSSGKSNQKNSNAYKNYFQQNQLEQGRNLNQNQSNIEQVIQEIPQLKQKQVGQNDEIEQEQLEGIQQNNSLPYYQINKYEPQDENYYNQHPQQNVNSKQQWSFDQQPQLPMLEETETPLFEEANPYLVQQQDQGTNQQQNQDYMANQKTQKCLELLEQKRNHLQIKLKQNMKRQDEINRLMQLKIDECKAVVPKNFQQILAFFRTKINMDREYTEQDEKQVQSFLAKRNLTDQRKFQNIYKIMHFEMQLDNTRRIIQGICKKLNQVQKQKQKQKQSSEYHR